MKIKIEFDCDNAAFTDGMNSEVAFVLKQAQDHLEKRTTHGLLRDSNGNTVGTYSKST